MEISSQTTCKSHIENSPHRSRELLKFALRSRAERTNSSSQNITVCAIARGPGHSLHSSAWCAGPSCASPCPWRSSCPASLPKLGCHHPEGSAAAVKLARDAQAAQLPVVYFVPTLHGHFRTTHLDDGVDVRALDTEHCASLLVRQLQGEVAWNKHEGIIRLEPQILHVPYGLVLHA